MRLTDAENGGYQWKGYTCAGQWEGCSCALRSKYTKNRGDQWEGYRAGVVNGRDSSKIQRAGVVNETKS